MNESELKEIFKATNTAEPLSEGWPGLLRFGLAVSRAERNADKRDAERYRWLRDRLLDAAIEELRVLLEKDNVKLRGRAL